MQVNITPRDEAHAGRWFCDTPDMAAWLLWLIAAGLFAAGEVVSLDLVLLISASSASS